MPSLCGVLVHQDTADVKECILTPVRVHTTDSAEVILPLDLPLAALPFHPASMLYFTHEESSSMMNLVVLFPSLGSVPEDEFPDCEEHCPTTLQTPTLAQIIQHICTVGGGWGYRGDGLGSPNYLQLEAFRSHPVLLLGGEAHDAQQFFYTSVPEALVDALT